MSKIKSATEKKQLSLEKDRRNVYGECPTSSRKNIARGKQRSHREQRRAVIEKLHGLQGASENLDFDQVESDILVRSLELQHYAFKKKPDLPLGLVIKQKAAKRER